MRFVVALCALVLIYWGATLAFMATVPLSGDEVFYTRNAAAIADLFMRGNGSFETVGRELVGRGWFMPGMSFALTPLYAFEPSPGVGLVRFYMAVVVFLLWLWTLREISRAFGADSMLALLVFPTLAGTWLMFTTTAWSDLPAGLLLVVLIARTYPLAHSTLNHMAISGREVLKLELVLLLLVYLRGNLIIVALAIHVFLLGLFLISRQWSQLLTRIGILAGGLLLFSAFLAPWSVAATRNLGDTVLTTSTLALSLGVSFGDTAELCFGPCPGADKLNLFTAASEYSRDYAQAHGLNELEVQRRMATNALQGLSFADYFGQVRNNFSSFVMQPTQFVTRFVDMSVLDLSSALRDRTEFVVTVLTWYVYAPFTAALMLANGVVIRRPKKLQVLSLCVKMITLCLFLQPFFHRSHGRYWPVFAPLASVAAIFLFKFLLAIRPSFASLLPMNAVPSERERSENGSRFLVGIQFVYVLMIVVVVGVLFWV